MSVAPIPFQVGDWVRRTQEGQSARFANHWRYGNQALQVVRVIPCCIDGIVDVFFAGDDTDYCGFYFEPAEPDLTAAERDTALGMALELAKLVEQDDWVVPSDVAKSNDTADWLRDCVARELWGGE